MNCSLGVAGWPLTTMPSSPVCEVFGGEDRQHGDPFPLWLPKFTLRRDRLPRLKHCRAKALQHLGRERRAANVLGILNWMAEGSSRPLSQVAATKAVLPLTATQLSVVERVRRRVVSCGERPAELSSAGALWELLRSSDLYGLEAQHSTLTLTVLTKSRSCRVALRVMSWGRWRPTMCAGFSQMLQSTSSGRWRMWTVPTRLTAPSGRTGIRG